MSTSPNIAAAAPNPAALTNLHSTMTTAVQARYACQALAAIAGQAAAESVVERLRDGTAQPAELADLLVGLRGPELGGACAALAKIITSRI